MKKLAIIVDSFSGKSKMEVEKLDNHFFIPLKIIIDGKEYQDGIKDNRKELLTATNNGKEIKTSQPAPADFVELFEKLSAEYENVIFLPTPNCISGTYQSGAMIAKDYANVHVISGIAVGSEYFEISHYLLKLAEEGKPIEEIISFAKAYINEILTFIIPRDVKAFVAGGRLGKRLSIFIEKMKIIPIVAMDNEIKLKKAAAVKRSGKKAAEYAVNKLLKIMSDKNISDFHDYQFLICHTLDRTNADYAAQYFESKNIKVKMELTSSIVNAHTGDGAYSVGAYRKLK